MLSIVSTPIGNLGDITFRAMDTLRNCDAIVCEDTRVAGKLLALLGLPKKELISFHGYSDPRKVDVILARLKRSERLCLVSDAGTPCISDPGYALVAAARKADMKIEVVPGPSAFLAALSASGLPINRFTYFGFLPLKKGRATLLQSLRKEERTVVFYESPHRIERTLIDLAVALGDQPGRRIVVARELTKLHEETLTFAVRDIGTALMKLTIKGEFVIVISAAPSAD